VKYFSKRIAYNIKNRFIIEKFKIVFVSAFFMFIVFSGYFKKVFKKINNFKIIYIKNVFYINYFKIINFFMYEVVRNVAVFVMNNFFFLFRNIDFSIINDTGRFANYIHMVSDNTSVKPLFFDTDYSIVFNNYKIY